MRIYWRRCISTFDWPLVFWKMIFVGNVATFWRCIKRGVVVGTHGEVVTPLPVRVQTVVLRELGRVVVVLRILPVVVPMVPDVGGQRVSPHDAVLRASTEHVSIEVPLRGMIPRKRMRVRRVWPHLMLHPIGGWAPGPGPHALVVCGTRQVLPRMLLALVVALVLLLLALLVLHVLLVRNMGWGLRRRPRVLLQPVAHGGSAVLRPDSFSLAAREAVEPMALRLSVARVSVHWSVASVAVAANSFSPIAREAAKPMALRLSDTRVSSH